MYLKILKADTHEEAKLAPATRSRNRFAPEDCSLMFNQFDSMEQNPGAKILLRKNFFRMKSLVQTRELCSGSMLRERVAGAGQAPAWCTGALLPQ